MSGTVASPIQDLDNLYHALAVLCAATTPVRLFEHLAQTLHGLTENKPVALFRRLGTGELRLTYCFPTADTVAPYKDILSIRSFEELSSSELQYYELKGEHGIWGYVGHPHSLYQGSMQWANLLVDIAAQRLRLLKAERMVKCQLRLKTRRKLLSRDIKHFTTIEHILQQHGDSWCDIFQASGIAVAYQGNLHYFGECPSKPSLCQQLRLLRQPLCQDETTELTGHCQGGLAAPLSLTTSHLGWLLLFRQQPLIPSPEAHSDIQDSLSYWMPLEASMIVGLADDLAVAITALEVVHLNRQLIKTNQRLEGLAHTDPLTKCWNRYYTELVIEDLSQSDIPFALMMFDIDDFKRVNDTYGHGVGDDILRNIAYLVQKTLRTDDHLGRWGGEEFIVITRGLGHDTSLQLANRLCRTVEKHIFPSANRVTISIGLTLAHPNDQPHPLLKRVDRAMYLAKAAGKNQVVICE
ncbi:GGDEF domain-containing protein [Vreelandella olivaria]|uniref:GGDEF domain-containing protein n=1 Tax=Vreelandella olivaria TaxID=390919 RepID=UPI00201EB8E2|nr:GGDEF domain-containing protein [Halomonas olivaria]